MDLYVEKTHTAMKKMGFTKAMLRKDQTGKQIFFQFEIGALSNEQFRDEVRILLDRSVDEFDKPIREKGILIKIPHKDILKKIIVAPEAPDWFVTLISDVATKYKIKVPCCSSALSVQPI